MVLDIVTYGHPMLRQKGKRIDPLTPEVGQLVDDMLETMRDALGVGLAAQQVGHALQLAVIDTRGLPDRPSWLEVNGQRVEVAGHMPMVLINPEVSPVGEPVAGPEGCLSFPEFYGEITRPESVDVATQDRAGRLQRFRCGGLLARAIQHEFDHLRGILFIDRMTRERKEELKPDLEALQAETKATLKKQASG